MNIHTRTHAQTRLSLHSQTCVHPLWLTHTHTYKTFLGGITSMAASYPRDWTHPSHTGISLWWTLGTTPAVALPYPLPREQVVRSTALAPSQSGLLTESSGKILQTQMSSHHHTPMILPWWWGLGIRRSAASRDSVGRADGGPLPYEPSQGQGSMGLHREVHWEGNTAGDGESSRLVPGGMRWKVFPWWGAKPLCS